MKPFTLLLLLLPLVFSCKKAEPEMQVSTEQIESDYPGGQYDVTVQCSTAWTVSANYPPDQTERGWIHFDRQEGENGTSQLTVVVEPSLGNSRAGFVVFKMDGEDFFFSFPVRQQGKLDRDMSDLLSSELLEFMARKGLIHHAFVEEQGKVWYSDLLGFKTLDISGETFDFMDDLAFFENLEELSCVGCGIKEFRTPMPCLRVLNCGNNELSVLDPELFPQLEELDCSQNRISQLDPNAFPHLRFLSCSGNPIEALDIVSVPQLTRLWCSETLLTELAVGPELTILVCDDAKLETLVLSQSSQLRDLECEGNRLRELDLSQTRLESLWCSRNPELSNLVLSAQLTSLNCQSCHLSGSLSIPSSEIIVVKCADNQLSRLVLPEGAQPNTIDCANNLLEELVIPDTSKLTVLNCENNLLAGVGTLSKGTYWQATRFQGNPGKDGVFTLSIHNGVYYQAYQPSSWNWQGNEVILQVLTVQ